MAQLLDGLDVVYAADEAAESSDDNPNDSDDSDASLGSGGVADASLGSDGVADASLGSGGAAAARAAVVVENGSRACGRARLAPGVFGAAVALRNEPRAARRIEVAAVRAAARGARRRGRRRARGHQREAAAARRLGRGAAGPRAVEPWHALAAVDALLWRARAAAGGGAPAGGELCVHRGAGAAGVTWARRAAFPGRARADGALAAAAVGGRAARLHVRPGDVLVGLNHEPVPRRHAAAALLQRSRPAAPRAAR